MSSGAMDMYLNTTDSISLPEMLDIDIKSEIDTLVGGHNDFSGFNFADLPPLELDDASDIRWVSSSNSNMSNSSFNLDQNGDGSAMVNPNTVMPFGSKISLAQSLRSPSPTIKESHLTFSPSNFKLENAKPGSLTVKKDLLNKLNNLGVKKKPAGGGTKGPNKVASMLAKPIVVAVEKAVCKSNATIISFKNTIQPQLIAPMRTTTTTTIGTGHSRKQQINNGIRLDSDRTYPKPGYSYSCLIAMALKNSRTGSLPVSEIYNFMCRHFPYFKTAPNGWKNSVRHNLSLNKCFEKIDKPAINGAQRKGCLWAMNPAKITKMDDEVTKWSKKDPMAIRKAMVYPDQLEKLERGELKFTYEDADNFGDSCGSADSEEGSDTEPEVDNGFHGESRFFNVSTIKSEVDDDYDIEVTDTVYDEIDVEQDEGKLIVEMALAQKELLEYDRCVSNKRRRIFLLQE